MLLIKDISVYLGLKLSPLGNHCLSGLLPHPRTLLSLCPFPNCCPGGREATMEVQGKSACQPPAYQLPMVKKWFSPGWGPALIPAVWQPRSLPQVSAVKPRALHLYSPMPGLLLPIHPVNFHHSPTGFLQTVHRPQELDALSQGLVLPIHSISTSL